MQPGFKAGVLVTGLFGLGIALGLLWNGSLVQRRAQEMVRLREPGGFVAHMEEVLQPRDSAQRAAIRPFLVATDARNRLISESAAGSMRAAMDSLQSALAPLLDPAQRDRLAEAARRPPPPRGGEGPPRGPPPR
ncbi:MAG: hypothetical protein V4558_10030 [Gemmatimonadota bacterium]